MKKILLTMVLVLLLCGCSKNENKDKETAVPSKSETLAQTKEETEEFNTYVNVRFGYTIKYPKELGIVTTSDNGDGATIQSKDKSVKLTMYASNNVLEETIRTYLDNAGDTCIKSNGNRMSSFYKRGTACTIETYDVERDFIISYKLEFDEKDEAKYKKLNEKMFDLMSRKE